MMLVDPKEDPCYVHVDILDDRVIFNPVYLRRLDSTFDFVCHVTFFSQISLLWLVKKTPMKSSHEIVKVLKCLRYV